MPFSVPNVFTLIRFVLAPFFAWAFLGDGFVARAAALILFVAAALTDLYDGILARRTARVTAFGKIADPIADKLLTGTAFVLLAWEAPQWVPPWAVALILIREVAVTAWRLRALARGRVLPAENWGKWKTTAQMTAIIWALVVRVLSAGGLPDPLPGIGDSLALALFPLTLLAATLTLVSAWAYVSAKN